MKLEQIMKDRDSLLSGKWFKRKYRSYCVRWNNDKFLFEMLLGDCRNKDKTIVVYHFNPEDFVEDDWEWVKEWYEGDFRKKYPNGILCYVWGDSGIKYMRVVTDYKEPFGWDTDQGYWKNAAPIPKEQAPVIYISEED